MSGERAFILLLAMFIVAFVLGVVSVVGAVLRKGYDYRPRETND